MKSENKFIQFIYDYVLPVVVTLVILWIVQAFLITKVRVSGSSMEPNLKNNQSIVVYRQAKIKHLSVIVFNASGEDPQANGNPDYYVKRVIGLPGDKVAFKDGTIYVNNKQIKQTFISKYERTKGTQIPAYKITNWDIHKLAANWPKNKQAVTVPKGEYFVLGDHRSVSNDSRYWGFVPKDKIMGVVHVFEWPAPFNGNNTNKQQQENINSLSYE
ncbi:signal peptidase I [Nicoliella spurrieriana]|uniref:Signal peptidase I n=1 Tax=Nicoliella spurrieriana TaxID=2925830 RepID=A0A976RSW5_9LACO|nr:signal peptidase I [Nicoliella spurrieriana]UQS87235.1 signal peptidase I [Nicoliella spurrieriana]